MKIIGARAVLLAIGLIPATLGIVPSAQAAFIHPGALSKQSDLDRMKAKVAANQQPWLGGWNNLVASTFSQSSRVPNPVVSPVRGGCHVDICPQSYTSTMQDAAAAYQNALRWHISGITAHANCAVNILNAWANTMTSINTCCSDHVLLAGITGYQFACAGELMRNYSGWSASDFTKFKNWMKTVWYPVQDNFLRNHLDPTLACPEHFWCNWDAGIMAGMISIGVLCDDQAIFNQAVNYYKTGAGNGALNNAIFVRHGAGLGQWQESGRDQGHNQLGLGLISVFLEVAWNQGVDLYGYVGADGRVYSDGSEYVMKYNLGDTVPYSTYNWCNGDAIQTVISPRVGIASLPELVYNAYRRKGITLPYTSQAAASVRPDWGAGHLSTGASWAFDMMGFTTLTHTIDTTASGTVGTAFSYTIKPYAFNLIRSNHTVVISFSLFHSDQVTVRIYNLSGRETATLVNKNLASGSHSVNWDTKNIAAGCYTVRMQAGTNTYVRSIPIMR
jgi:hypothetical protein